MTLPNLDGSALYRGDLQHRIPAGSARSRPMRRRGFTRSPGDPTPATPSLASASSRGFYRLFDPVHRELSSRTGLTYTGGNHRADLASRSRSRGVLTTDDPANGVPVTDPTRPSAFTLGSGIGRPDLHRLRRASSGVLPPAVINVTAGQPTGPIPVIVNFRQRQLTTRGQPPAHRDGQPARRHPADS